MLVIFSPILCVWEQNNFVAILNSALQQLLFQQTYSLFLGWLLVARTEYRNMDKCCEEIPGQGKDLHNS